MKTLVLCGGDFAHTHLRVCCLPRRIELYYKLHVVVTYEKSVRNQGLSDLVVFDYKTRKPVDESWRTGSGPLWVKFVGTM